VPNGRNQRIINAFSIEKYIIIVNNISLASKKYYLENIETQWILLIKLKSFVTLDLIEESLANQSG
jgi:hypothetical protein